MIQQQQPLQHPQKQQQQKRQYPQKHPQQQQHNKHFNIHNHSTTTTISKDKKKIRFPPKAKKRLFGYEERKSMFKMI